MTLIIRNEQTTAFDQSLTDEYVARLAAQLRTEYAEDVEDLTDEELRRKTAEGVERAEGYGLQGDADVAAFVKLLFTIGWYFDEYPMFHGILTEELYEHYQKIPFLFESATDDDWEAAAEFSDEELQARQK